MKTRRRLLAWILTIAMIVPVIPAYAVENENETVVAESVETTEEIISSEEVQVESETEKETLAEVTSEETEEAVISEETSEEVSSEEATSETEETTEEATTEAKFDELDNGFVLSDEQKELKEAMSGTLSTLAGATAGIDYVADEIYFLSDDRDEAEAVALAYGGTLSEFSYGVATVTLPGDVSVMEAVEFAADEDTNMLAVMPNFYAHLDEEIETEITEAEIDDTDGDIDILQVVETEIADEEDELGLEANVDASYTDPYLHNAASKYQYQHAAVGSMYAWKAGYKGSGVKVAVIDSGVNAQSGELPVASAKNCYSDGSSANDENGHGTHVAGIIAARLNGNYGAGIAPEASIYNIRVGDAKGSIDYDDELRGLNAAIDYNVDIVNMSLGGIWSSPDFQAVVDKAYDNGIAIFASSGNDGGQIDSYPACYNHVMSVGSTNEVNARSDFSNINTRVAFCGPGSRIWSTDSAGGDYVQMSGTSMSCPAVSGIAAVILSSSDFKDMTKNASKVEALKDRMTKSSKYVAPKCGSGIPYLPKALNITTEGEKPKAPEITYTISSDYKTVSFKIKADTFSNIIYTTDGKIPSLKVPVATQKREGNVVTGDVSVTKNKVTIKAIAVNESGLSSALKSSVATIKPNVASIGISGITKVAAGKTAVLTTTVLPDFAVDKKLNWTITPANQGVTVNNGRVATTKTATTGKYTVKATAADGGGANKSFTIEVIAAEYVKSVAFNEKQVVMTRKASNTTKDISALLNGVNVNGSKLGVTDFIWSTNKPAIATVANGVVTATGPGVAVITALANDGSGKKATISVKVNQQINTITLSCPSTKVAAGKKVTIKATVKPDKPTSAKLVWSVSPAGKGVTVNNGTVSVARDAVNTEYTITATAFDGGGASASKKLTVISGGITKIVPEVKSDVIFRVSDSQNPNVNEPTSKTINVEVAGDMGADTSMLMATSSNTGVATVSGPVKNGSKYVFSVTATGNQTGSTVITIASTDGSSKVAKVNIRVINPASSITVAAVNAETMDKIIEGKTVRLKANLGNLYGTPSTTKVKWTVKSVSPYSKTQYVNVASGVVKVKNGVGHQTNIVVTAELQDGSGLKTDIALKTVGKDYAVSKMYLADWFGHWSYRPATSPIYGRVNSIEEADKVIYLYPNAKSAVPIGGAMRVDSIKESRYYTRIIVDFINMDCAHFACSSGRNDVATPVMNGPIIYVSPKKAGSTTIVIADKVSGKSCKYKVVVTADPKFRSRCIN